MNDRIYPSRFKSFEEASNALTKCRLHIYRSLQGGHIHLAFFDKNSDEGETYGKIGNLVMCYGNYFEAMQVENFLIALKTFPGVDCIVFNDNEMIEHIPLPPPAPEPLAIAMAVSLYFYNVSPFERAQKIIEHFHENCMEMSELVREMAEQDWATRLPFPTAEVIVKHALEKYGSEAAERVKLERQYKITGDGRI